MDTINNRPYIEERDQEPVADLLLAYRAATRIDVYPTIWRFRLLLTSRVWEPGYDTCVWEDAAGRMIGFAMLWRRRREDDYLVQYRIVHPAFVTDDLVDMMVLWGNQRAEAIAAERAVSLRLFVNALNPAALLPAIQMIWQKSRRPIPQKSRGQ